MSLKVNPSTFLVGEGQFGVVKRAELAYETGQMPTTVAVKQLKMAPDLTDTKALMSELKIMIYLGRNENLVNVLGACTKILKDRRLWVVVEYCEHGNLLNILRSNK